LGATRLQSLLEMSQSGGESSSRSRLVLGEMSIE
jgi:hypothetical protein